MTSRERVVAAINHKAPDRVPMDLGGSAQTGINASTLYKLRIAYGLPVHPIRICEPIQMLGEVEPDLLSLIGVDVIPLWNPGNGMGVINDLTQPWKMPDGTPVVMAKEFVYTATENGDTFAYPCGDSTVEPSYHMPSGGSFFDFINRSPDFNEDNLTPVEDFQDSYKLHNEETCIFWERESKRLFEQTDLAVLGSLGGGALGDAADIPGATLKHPKGIRRMSDWLMAHVLYPEYIEAVFTIQTDIMLKNLSLYKEAVGERIQVVWISGTDFGTQNSQFMSTEVFTKLYKPFYKRINDWVHSNTSWKTFYHCCGAVSALVPEFIEMGVDILNPVQCSAAGMDARNLKDSFGDSITFWGGAVNTQQTLPFGTTSDVRREVLERLKVFSTNGGFVFAAIHNIVAKTPVENVVAMFDALSEYRSMLT